MESYRLSEDDLVTVFGTIRNRIMQANLEGTIVELLRSMGFPELVPEEGDEGAEYYDERPDGDIIVLGNLPIAREHLLGVAESMGIDKSRFQFRGYNEVKNRSCQVWRYNPSIAVILCGPLPHKADGIGDNSGLIAALKNEPGYPPLHVFRQGNGALKISKTKFKEVLWALMNQGIIRAA